MSYLGYPGTVGGRFVEYIIGDDYTVPVGAEQLYPEKVIRIPPTYQIND
jgi:predicted O-linked N-acetylglucosamine transferase (SPINDLY family)